MAELDVFSALIGFYGHFAVLYHIKHFFTFSFYSTTYVLVIVMNSNPRRDDVTGWLVSKAVCSVLPLTLGSRSVVL